MLTLGVRLSIVFSTRTMMPAIMVSPLGSLPFWHASSFWFLTWSSNKSAVLKTGKRPSYWRLDFQVKPEEPRSNTFSSCSMFILLSAYLYVFRDLFNIRAFLLLGLWAFLWFVGFCFLANQWQRTTPDKLPLNQGADAARAAIAFSFFSIFTWVSAA